jgi:hypothetical protein
VSSRAIKIGMAGALAAGLAGYYLGHLSSNPGSSTVKVLPPGPARQHDAHRTDPSASLSSSPELPSESITGMASPDAATGAGAPPSEPSLVPITLTPQRMQSIGVKTGIVEFRPVRGEIRTVGNIEADETRISDVQIRFAGWVQKVYADAMYKQVRRGQPLLTIYSPEVVTAEQEYLVAKELLAQTTIPGGAAGSHGSQSLLLAATERLKQWQIPDREIARLKESGKIRHELEIDAPVSGFIIERKAFPNMYVQPGTKLYSVADLSTVWVQRPCATCLWPRLEKPGVFLLR